MSSRPQPIELLPEPDTTDPQAESDSFSAVLGTGRYAQLRRRRAIRGTVLRSAAARQANGLNNSPEVDTATLNDYLSNRTKKYIIRCGSSHSKPTDPSSSSSPRRPNPIHLPSFGSKRKFDDMSQDGPVSKSSNGCEQVLDHAAVPNVTMNVWTSVYPSHVSPVDDVYAQLLEFEDRKRCSMVYSNCGCSKELCGCTSCGNVVGFVARYCSLHRPALSAAARELPTRSGIFSFLPSRVSASPEFTFTSDLGPARRPGYRTRLLEEEEEVVLPRSRRQRRVNADVDETSAAAVDPDFISLWPTNSPGEERDLPNPPGNDWYALYTPPAPEANERASSSQTRRSEFRAARRRNWLAARVGNEDSNPPPLDWAALASSRSPRSPPISLNPMSSTARTDMNILTSPFPIPTSSPLPAASSQEQQLLSRGQTWAPGDARHLTSTSDARLDTAGNQSLSSREMGFGVVRLDPNLDLPPPGRSTAHLSYNEERSSSSSWRAREGAHSSSVQSHDPRSQVASDLQSSPRSRSLGTSYMYATRVTADGRLENISPPLPPQFLDLSPPSMFGARSPDAARGTRSDWSFSYDGPPFVDLSDPPDPQAFSAERTSQNDDEI